MSKTPPPYPKAHNLLEDKTVLITAAAGTGIGSATAKRCAEEGATLMISDLHERRLGETADRIEQETGVRPFTQLCNVTQEGEVKALIAAAVDQLGHVDILINNAGLGGSAPLVEMTDEQWNMVLDVTLTGTFRMMRAMLPHMYDRKAGVIVQQRLCLGLAGPSLASPLCRGQSGGHGSDPVRCYRSGRAQCTDQCGGAEPGHA